MSVDQLVLLSIALGFTAFAVLQVRRGARGRALAAALVAGFYGIVLVTMLVAHSVEIGYHTVRNDPSFTDGTPFRYDWRTYSLQLFGVLLIVQGARCVRAATGLARGEPGARSAFVRAAGLVLAIVLPIIPIHAFFGWLISGLSGLALAGVVAATARPAGARSRAAISVLGTPAA